MQTHTNQKKELYTGNINGNGMKMIATKRMQHAPANARTKIQTTCIHAGGNQEYNHIPSQMTQYSPSKMLGTVTGYVKQEMEQSILGAS